MPHPKALLHLVTEFVPVVAFFLAGHFLHIYTATIILIVSTLASLLVGLLCAKRLPILPIISTVFVVVSGCITLHQHQPEALIISDSLYYFLLAVVVATGLSFRFNVLKYFFGHTFAMRNEGWDILAFRWMTIFIIAGAANEWVRIVLTPEDWMNFRFLKVITLTVFGCLQVYTARRYRLPDQSNSWGLRITEDTHLVVTPPTIASK